MATIIDVAKAAGVSIKTVSRVMNNHAYVSDETRRRVEQAISRLNYTPSEAARDMRTGRSRAIGMLYGDPGSGYQSKLNHAMMQACSRVGQYLAVGLFEEGKGGWKEQMEAFLDRTKVDNMLLVPPMCDSSVLHEYLTERDVRFVLLSPSRPAVGACSISMDDRRAAREMTCHLIALGHRRIGHIMGNPDHISSLLRRQGYEEALASEGLGRPDPSHIAEGRFDFRIALQAAEKMLAEPDRPTAIFAASDDMAAAAYMAAGRLGLAVPEDVSIAGFDDVAIAKTIWPSLTTVAQPFGTFANEAVRLLMERREGPKPKARAELIVVPHALELRESCAPLAAS